MISISYPSLMPWFEHGSNGVVGSVGAEAEEADDLDGDHLVEHRCAVEVEILNFKTALQIVREPSRLKDSAICEIHADGIMCAAGCLFGLAVSWSVNADGTPDPGSRLGAYVTRLDKQPLPVKVYLKEVHVQNSIPGESVSKWKHQYTTLELNDYLGWWFDTIRVRDLLAPEGTWLVGGSLQLGCHMLVKLPRARGTCVPTGESFNDRSSRAVCESLDALFNASSFADVIVEVADRQIPAHAAVLGVRCAVFGRMLMSPMREAETRRIYIGDMDYVTAYALLAFIYTGNVRPEDVANEGMICALLEAAHRFELPLLMERCTLALVPLFKVEAVSDLLQMAIILEYTFFQAQCVAFMQANMQAVMCTASFENLLEKYPEMLRIIDVHGNVLNKSLKTSSLLHPPLAIMRSKVEATIKHGGATQEEASGQKEVQACHWSMPLFVGAHIPEPTPQEVATKVLDAVYRSCSMEFIEASEPSHFLSVLGDLQGMWA